MDLTELIGFTAAFLTTVAFLPQTLLVLRTRDVSGVSLGMYSLFCAGIALWLVYGLLKGAWPLIIANLITLGLSSSILVMRIRFAKQAA